MAFANGGSIVTNGLVLALDAADRNSYVSGSTTWFDVSGNNNSGSLTNGPTFNSGNGGSIVFDGTNDYVNNGNILDTDGTSPFSVSVWFKTSSTSNGTKTLVSKNLLSSPYTGWQLGFNTTTSAAGDIGKVGIVIVSNTTEVMRKLTTATYNNGIWHNAVFIYSGSKTRAGMLLYINGALGTVTESDSTSIVNTISNASNYIIGGRNNQAGQVFPAGNIANVTHYNRALSLTEISQNYNAQKSRFGL
jgi:hypothetical protein